MNLPRTYGDLRFVPGPPTKPALSQSQIDQAAAEARDRVLESNDPSTPEDPSRDDERPETAVIRPPERAVSKRPASLKKSLRETLQDQKQ